MIDYHRMWKMSDMLKNSTFRVKSGKKTSSEERRRLIRGEVKPQEAIPYRHYMGGGVPKDLIGTGRGGGDFILSDRVIEALRAGKFTGWSTYPVRITGKSGEDVPGYHGLVITGRCMQDQSKGEVTMERPDGQSARMRGLFLDEKTWDGSDIFMLGVAGSICMTEPVHDAIMALKPTNIRFTRLEEVVWLYINRNQPAN